MEASKEVLITYETLFEILRREKSNEELQRLDPNFFNDVFTYLAQKQRIYDNAAGKTDLFSVDEREKTQMQLYNIRRVIKELYERREKKILEMAMNKSKTNSNIMDTSNLLDQEKTFFESMVSTLDSYRERLLMKILELKEASALETAPKAMEQPAPEPAPEPEQPTELTPAPALSTKKVKFLKAVEAFIGKELESYGPYEQGAVAELPAEVAQPLIHNKDAEEV